MKRYPVLEVDVTPTSWVEVKEPSVISNAQRYDSDADTDRHSGTTYAMAGSAQGGLHLKVGYSPFACPMMSPVVAADLMGDLSAEAREDLNDTDVTAVYMQSPNHCGGSLTRKIVAIEV